MKRFFEAIGDLEGLIPRWGKWSSIEFQTAFLKEKRSQQERITFILIHVKETALRLMEMPSEKSRLLKEARKLRHLFKDFAITSFFNFHEKRHVENEMIKILETATAAEAKY